MQAEVQEYEDPASGARHIHLVTSGPDMVFMVGFPTVPQASDGRAHILEHLALCGSARYPVRDPFFSMLRRSTAHFMNAMTYSDKTVYPFASTDKTDYFNLLDVYLDAAFFPNLDYLDFRQEGWRLVIEDGRLAYQGVVFNEMKGAFADPMRALDDGICSQLFKGTTYEYESGGDPLVIPSLTHAALKEFHATHYHPSQAVFMTAGPVAPLEVQNVIEERVLSRLSGPALGKEAPGRAAPRMLPELAQPWSAPRAVSIDVPSQEYGVQISWLMGETADAAEYHLGRLLEAGLLGNASAPLTYAMESAGFGRPSQMNGADTERRQMLFHLGMEGLTQAQVGPARERIWAALEKTAKQGVPASLLQAALRDIRFDQREISGGYAPDPLKRLLRAMPFEMYGGDILDGFDQEAVLARLQRDIADPEFFKGLVRRLLDSPARLDATVVPDAAYFQKRKAIEDERLAQLDKSLSDAQKETLRAESAALLERQRRSVNNDVLPRIRPQDVSPLPRPALPLPLPEDSHGAIAVSIPSNGISYANVLYEISDMDPADWPWLALYVDVLPDLGVGAKSYEEADAWRHDRVPFFDVKLRTLQVQDADRTLRIHVDFHAKGLREENAAIAGVLFESIRDARFDESERLAFLIDSMVQEMRNSLAEEGDDYARLSATAPLSPARHFEDSIHGIASLPFYAELHRKSQTEQGLSEIRARLADLHRRIVGRAPVILAAGAGEDGRELAALLELPKAAAASKPGLTAGAAKAPDRPLDNSALHADAQVNHCFAAWAVPGLAHPDAPALSVLGELLTNQVLHQALREEGGAYGGQSAYFPSLGTFVMMSYRDPRLRATYADFERALAWIASAELEQENIEEAIVCVIQSLDKPRTPYAEAMWAWEQQQQGITEEMRRRFREGVLHCTGAALKAATAAWLMDKPYSRAAFAGSTAQDLAGLTAVDLMQLAS